MLYHMQDMEVRLRRQVVEPRVFNIPDKHLTSPTIKTNIPDDQDEPTLIMDWKGHGV